MVSSSCNVNTALVPGLSESLPQAAQKGRTLQSAAMVIQRKIDVGNPDKPEFSILARPLTHLPSGTKDMEIDGP